MTRVQMDERRNVRTDERAQVERGVILLAWSWDDYPAVRRREEVRAVGNITVGRYDHPDSVGYQGWIEPDDQTWIAFVASNGSPVVFLNRDPETGAVL